MNITPTAVTTAGSHHPHPFHHNKIPAIQPTAAGRAGKYEKGGFMPSTCYVRIIAPYGALQTGWIR